MWRGLRDGLDYQDVLLSYAFFSMYFTYQCFISFEAVRQVVWMGLVQNRVSFGPSRIFRIISCHISNSEDRCPSLSIPLFSESQQIQVIFLEGYFAIWTLIVHCLKLKSQVDSDNVIFIFFQTEEWQRRTKDSWI